MGIFTKPLRNIDPAPSDLIYLDNIHANSVIFQDVTFLIKGDSGAGKSSLSLQIMNQGGSLISDDRTLIYTDHNDIYVGAHKEVSGKMEVRGIGIIDVPFENIAKCDVIIEVTDKYPRYPTQKDYVFYKKMLNYYKLNPFENTILEKLKIIAHTMKNHPQGLK